MAVKSSHEKWRGSLILLSSIYLNRRTGEKDFHGCPSWLIVLKRSNVFRFLSLMEEKGLLPPIFKFSGLTLWEAPLSIRTMQRREDATTPRMTPHWPLSSDFD